MDTTLASAPTTSDAPAAVAPSSPATNGADFVDRRGGGNESIGRERRQFTNSHSELSPEAAELATAIDAYKLRTRRRFINYEEMLTVLKSLGYSK